MAGRYKNLKKQLKEHWPFGIVFLTAIILRFWNLSNADFSHDELSALVRTQFDSFNELIEQAVRVDGHPALVQVFLYYWSPAVHFSPFWIKLPSVIFGLATILMVYLSAVLLKRKPQGLFAVLIMASSGFFLYHHQTARPYAWGGFFVSVAAYAYVAYFFKKKQLRYLVLFAIGASLAAYTHYMALLSVLLMGLSALWRTRLKPMPWLLTGLFVLLLFSPHLGIFFDQLKLGGVGQWLGKPSWNWLFTFFDYLGNYFILGLFLAAVIALKFVKKEPNIKFPEAWLWFLLCFSIAFFYSHFRDPLLQFSTLIFLCPFLLLALPIGFRFKNISFIILLVANTFGLVKVRSYFSETHLSPAKETQRYLKLHALNEVPVYYHWSEEKWDFYNTIDPSTAKATFIESLPPKNLRPNEFVLLADHMVPRHWPVQLIDEGYSLSKWNPHFGFDLYHFKKEKETKSDPTKIAQLSEPRNFEGSEAPYFLIDSLKSLDHKTANNPRNFVVLRFNMPQAEGMFAVIQIFDGSDQIGWYASPLKSGLNYISRPVGNYGLLDFTWRVLIDRGSSKYIPKGSLNATLHAGNPKIFGLVKDF